MMRILNLIAKTENAKGIVTGDSVGQVASQTLDNITCIYDAATLPILPPLIGMNKDEIVQIAHKIGTYESSIKPYPDCCSFMIAEHPETKGDLATVKKIEEEIDVSLVEECVKQSKIEKI
jgi:thiamine biosynthesis protein ThiI